MNKEGQKNISDLLSGVMEYDWWKRKAAIEDLVLRPVELYLRTLEDWIRNGDDALARNVSLEIYRGLGARGIPSLLKLLNDSDADVRILAANVLGDIRSPESVPNLIESLKEPEENVRAAAAEALGKIADRKALTSLASCIDDIPWVAMAAIEAIGRIGGEESVVILRRCLDNAELRPLAVAAIGDAGKGDEMVTVASYVDEEGAGDIALKSLVKISEREGIVPDSSILELCRNSALRHLASADRELKIAAIMILAWLRDAQHINELIEAVNDYDLQEYALNALAGLGALAAPALLEALRKTEINRPVIAKLLSMSGAAATLMEFIRDPDPEVRTESALALGDLATAEAEAALGSLLGDPVREVKEAASVSLKKIRKRTPGA